MEKRPINSIEKMKQLLKEKKIAEQVFLETTYLELSLEKQAQYWAGRFARQMRQNGEAGARELEVLDKETYKFCMETDPNFQRLIPEIATILQMTTDKLEKLLLI